MMKKLFTLVAVLFASATMAHAQFGIVAGLNFSNTNLSVRDMWEQANSVTRFHAGVAYKFNLGMGFAVQPQLTYEMKGASIKDSQNFAAWSSSLKADSGFLELGVGLQWGPDLFIGRPFVMLQPFLGYQIYSKDNAERKVLDTVSISNEERNKALDAAKNRLEYGFGVGAGIELIKHLQLSVQYFINLGNLYTDGKVDGNQVWDTIKSEYKDIKNYNGVKVTLGFFF